MGLFRRLANMTRPGQLSRDINREIAFHVAELADELQDQGYTKEDAHREAHRRFGHHSKVHDRVQSVNILRWLESLLNDVRLAMRSMVRNPGFTFVAVASLGLGIGANTAIFSLINAVMLRSLPVAHPDELVQITYGDGGTSFTNPLWEQIRNQETDLAGALAFADAQFDLTSGGPIRRVDGAWVSGQYFDVLGVPPAAGRLLGRADDYRGCPNVVALSHDFWRREYGTDPNVVGRTIRLGPQSFEVVGVVAPGFRGLHVGLDADAFAPLCSLRDQDWLDARSTWFIKVFGRRRADATLEDVRTNLAAVSPAVFGGAVPTHWTSEEQQEFRQRSLGAVSAATGFSNIRGQYDHALLVLLSVVAIVLLIACANVAQLLLARTTARQHEISVRLAIGSGRVRLVRQLVTESIFLALLGACVGVVFARWSSELVVRLISQGQGGVALDLSLDLRVLFFTILTALVTGILFAAAPAWRSIRVDPLASLRGAGRGIVGDSRFRLTKGIVTGQVALSMVLVMAAALLVGSFRRLTLVDPGFRSTGVLVITANWSNLELPSDQHHVFVRQALDRLRTTPGVTNASASLILPFGGSSWNEEVITEGFTPQNSRESLVWFNAATEGYLETIGNPLIAGRDFAENDGAESADVVLINQTAARRFFGNANPLGRIIRTKQHDSVGPPLQVVGTVQDIKHQHLDETTLAMAYVPLDQTDLWGPTIEFAVLTNQPADQLIPVVTETLQQVDAGLAFEFSTLDDNLAASLARSRLLAALSGFFGVLALLLCVMGLYGTISYSVTKRRNEFGIRIALGASQPNVLRIVANEAAKMVVAGVILGGVLALMMTRLVSAFLYDVESSDPVSLAVSAGILAAIAFAASVIPALHATKVDPMVALRDGG